MVAPESVKRRPRTRAIGAMVLIAGVVTVPIALQASPASAAGQPTIDTPADGSDFVYTGQLITLSGTSGLAGNVSSFGVTLDGVDQTGCLAPTSTLPFDGLAGEWSCQSIADVAPGPHVLIVSQVEGGVGTSAQSNFTVDPLNAPTINAPYEGDIAAYAVALPGTQSDFYPSLGGAGDPGATVTVSAHNSDLNTDTVLCTTTVSTDGNFWNCDAETSFDFGHSTYSAVETLGSQTSPASESSAVNVYNNDSNAVSIQSPANGTLGTSAPPISGYGPAEGTVAVYDNGGDTQLCDVAVALDGTWSCPALTLPDGQYAAFATATYLPPYEDAFNSTTSTTGNTDFIVETPPDAPVITAPTSGYDFTGEIPVNISGTVTASDRPQAVIVSVNGATVNCDGFEGGDIPLAAGETDWTCVDDNGYPAQENTFTAIVEYNDYAEFYPGFEFAATPSNPSGPSNAVTIKTHAGPPTMGYNLGPASIAVSASGLPGAGLSVERYTATPDGEGGYNFTLIDSCPPGSSEGEGGGRVFGPDIQPCSFANLAPGVWNFYSQQANGSDFSEVQDDYILVPAPLASIANTVNGDGTVTVFGTGGTPAVGPVSYGAQLLMNGAQITDANGNVVCADVPIDPSGNWTCTFTPAPGSYSLRANQRSHGFVAAGVPAPSHNSFDGYSALTAGVTSFFIPTPPPPPVPTETPTPGPTPTPTASQPPLVWTLVVTGDLYPGASVSLSSKEKLPAGSDVDAWLHSDPYHFGTTVVKADGTFLLKGTIPLDFQPGEHHFQVTVTPPGQVPAPVDNAVVLKPLDIVKQIPANVSHPYTGNGLVAARGDRNDPTTTSSFTSALVHLKDIIATPIIAGFALLGALALFLLVAFPAEVLNSTVSEQYPRFTRRFPGLKHRPRWISALMAFFERTPLVGGVLITIIASVIFAFADPNVGPDLVTLRVILGCVIALFIVGYLANAITGRIIRGTWDLDTRMELHPLGLILTIIGVILSRILDFSPGFLIGLLIGVAIMGRATKAQEGKSALIKAGIVWAMGVLAWILYSWLEPILAGSGFAGNLASETLVAISTEGLVALVIGMLPFAFLEGSSVWAWSKLAWIGTYVVWAFTFTIIVVPDAWGELQGSIWIWGSVLAGFAVVAFGIYFYFRFVARPLEEEEAEEPEMAEQDRV